MHGSPQSFFQVSELIVRGGARAAFFPLPFSFLLAYNNTEIERERDFIQVYLSSIQC